MSLSNSGAPKSDGSVPDNEFLEMSMWIMFLGNFGSVPLSLLFDNTMIFAAINSNVAGSAPDI